MKLFLTILGSSCPSFRPLAKTQPPCFAATFTAVLTVYLRADAEQLSGYGG